MRFKLLRRRLSISAPRMIVRSRLPWPLRWAVVALALGFSAAIASWAFEFGKDIAGLEHHSTEEVGRLRAQVEAQREQIERLQVIANTADSLLKADQAAQEKLATQLKQAEADNLALKADLGFFERLLPVAGAPDGLAVRGFQAEAVAPGQVRYQLLVMQNGRPSGPFEGRYELTMSGLLDGHPWSAGLPGGAQPLQVKQYARVEGRLEHPPGAVVKTIQVRVLNGAGAVMATQMAALGT
jgi:hypothetical protein